MTKKNISAINAQNHNDMIIVDKDVENIDIISVEIVN